MPTNAAATEEAKSLREIVKNLEVELLLTRQALANREQILASTEKTLATAEKRCASAEKKISLLLEQLYLLRHRVFGASAEDASPQGRLFNEAEAVADADVADEADHLADASPDNESTASPSRRAGRRPLPPHLPRVDIYHTLPEAERLCACGCVQQEIGADISEQLDIVPAQIRVLRHIRTRYACRCGDHAPVAAPLPAQPLPKSMASANTLALITVLKYVDGVPLYRIEQRVLQRAGAVIARQTLARWMIQLAALIQPLLNLLRDTLLECRVIHLDETTHQVLKEPDKPPQSTSYLWVQTGSVDQRTVVLFDYDTRRSADVPCRLLPDWQGVLMTDAYGAYNAIAARPGVVHLNCLAHARRLFIDAQRAQPKGKTGKADVALSLIGKLYAIERQIRDATDAQRLHARTTQSQPILQQLRNWLDTQRSHITPQGVLGKALNYLHTHWQKLTRFVEDPAWPIDNNRCENAIRPFVIGRKNFLFADTPAGAHASAALYSLIETAKANGHEPYRYLCHVFTQLPRAQSLTDFEALLPWRVSATDLNRVVDA